jgi:hypothetical protein
MHLFKRGKDEFQLFVMKKFSIINFSIFFYKSIYYIDIKLQVYSYLYFSSLTHSSNKMQNFVITYY